jgi:uncharacterized protein (TIGR03083 family)
MAVDLPAALLTQTRALGEIVRGADPATPVPTCPGWTLRELTTHVGRGDRWAATIVAQRAEAFIDPRTVPDGTAPADPAAAAGWLEAGARLLLDVVAAAPEAEVWTSLGPRPAGWWVRRRVHESLVHRADAALATGAVFAPAPDVAADAVSELLSLVAERPGGVPALPAGATMHLHATDDGLGSAGEWMVRAAESGISWEHGHAKGAVAVRGAAADLLLVLLRRLPADDARVQVLGDASVLDTWLARTPF